MHSSQEQCVDAPVAHSPRNSSVEYRTQLGVVRHHPLFLPMTKILEDIQKDVNFEEQLGQTLKKLFFSDFNPDSGEEKGNLNVDQVWAITSDDFAHKTTKFSRVLIPESTSTKFLYFEGQMSKLVHEMELLRPLMQLERELRHALVLYPLKDLAYREQMKEMNNERSKTDTEQDGDVSESNSSTKETRLKSSSRLSHASVSMMKEWLSNNRAHPYPSPFEKHQFAVQGGITLKQVEYWFNNTRAKMKAKLN